MKTHTFTLLAAVALLTLLAACDNDSNSFDSRSPTFGDFTLSPTSCYPGDTITGTVLFEDKGKHIYSTTYYYRYNVDDTITKVTWTVVDPTGHDNVTFTFPAPTTAGIYTITFGATTIRYSSGGPNGELYGSASSVTATLNVKSTSSSSDSEDDEDDE